MSEAVFVDCPRRNLLQSFRAQQAIGEAGYPVLVPPDETSRWEYASDWFEIPYRPYKGDGPRLSVGIDHELPNVSIGVLNRPLLFPHAIPDRLLGGWSDRTVRVSFMGNLPKARQRIIKDWVSRQPEARRAGWRRHPGKKFVFRSSRSGRSWPEKAWDPLYAELLGSSQFALCPNGTFVWTYRFFEAVMAGAIPIVEQHCSLYEGFIYHSMDVPLASLRWSESSARENANQVRSLVTAPTNDIRTAVATLLVA